jgi:hypothetical protein
MSLIGLEIDHWIEDILTALVSLRIFILHFLGFGFHTAAAETNIRYITRLSDHAPHLEYFTVNVCGRKVHCKRVNRKWVECDEAAFP